jgi:hypothetical protein
MLWNDKTSLACFFTMVLERHLMFIFYLISFMVNMNWHTICLLIDTPISYKSIIICTLCFVTNLDLVITTLISIGVMLCMLESCCVMVVQNENKWVQMLPGSCTYVIWILTHWMTPKDCDWKRLATKYEPTSFVVNFYESFGVLG